MTAREYCQSFAEQNDFWNPDKAAQAYIMALGANDLNGNIELGSADDIDLENCENNKETFAGYYAKIIQKYRAIEPKSRFLLMTMPRAEDTEENKEKNRKILAHQELLYRMAEVFPFTYVLDLVKYAPVYDTEFRKNFFLGGHMNPAGYVLTAKMIASYIDYIIRSNMEDFSQVGFIGTGFHNSHAKW